MKENAAAVILPKNTGRYFLLLAMAVWLLLVGSCSSGKSYSSKNLHRKPTSPGRNKCGCFLYFPDTKTFRSTYNTRYVFQA